MQELEMLRMEALSFVWYKILSLSQQTTIPIMKKILLIALTLILPTLCFAEGVFSKSEIIKVDSVSADELYGRAKVWIMSNFISPGDVLQNEDQVNKIITCKAAFDFSMGKIKYLAYEGGVEYVFTVQCREGRAKVQITNVNHKNLPGHAADCNLGTIMNDNNYSGMNKKYHAEVADEIKKIVSQKFATIVKGLTEAMNKPGVDPEDDW